MSASWLRELVTGLSASVESLPYALVVSDLTAIVVLLACAAAHRRLEGVVARGGVAWPLVALGACAGVGRLLATYVGADGALAWLGWVGLVAYSACEPTLMLVALRVCCRDCPTRAALVFSAAYAFAAALQLIVRCVREPVAGPLIGLLPLLAGIVLARYPGMRWSGQAVPRKGCEGAGEVGETDAPAASDGRADAETPTGCSTARAVEQPVVSWSFPLRPVVLMAVYSFTFYFSLAFSAGPNPFGALGMLLVSLLTLAAALVRRDGYSYTFLYRLALPLMVADLMFLSFLGGDRTLAVMFGNSGNVAFMLFLLITLTGMCHRYGISPTWMFGIVYAAQRLAGMVGLPAGEAFTATFPVGSETSRLVMCCVVVAVVVLSTVMFNDQAVARSFGMVPTTSPAEASRGAALGVTSAVDEVMSYSERIVWRCTLVAHRFGLTQREQEVLELLVQGMSAPEVARLASISVGTVKTHINHIYRKLDVHSREETMALVERAGR